MVENLLEQVVNGPWIFTALFFLCYSVVMWVGFSLYANALKFAGSLPRVLRFCVSIPAYLALCGLVILPFVILFKTVEPLRVLFNENVFYLIFFMVCFSTSFVPGALHFKADHIDDLRKLGYFGGKVGK